MDSELLERLERLERQVGALEGVARFVATYFNVESESSGFSFRSLMIGGERRHGVSVAGQAVEILSAAERRANGLYYFLDPAFTDAVAVSLTTNALQVYRNSGAGEPITWELAGAVGTPVVTDANGWANHYGLADRRVWTQRVKVTAGFPASTAYASMATLNLPVGVSSLADVDVLWSARADTWARVLLFGYDATDASTSIVFHGTVTDGVNWSAKGIAEVCFDVLLVER